MAVAVQHSSYSARMELEADLSRMAAQVESNLASAILAFERRDLAVSKRLIDADARIDEYDRDIEAKVITILGEGALPKEALLEVMTVMKLAGELERVGDLAKNVAKRTLVVSQSAPTRPTAGVIRMGRVCLRQFSDILNAYSDRNLSAAKAVWRGDDELDELYNSVFQDVLQAMMEDAGTVNACTHLVFIAKNFERVGDHATNIAEAVHFVMTGSPIMEERPKGDETSSIAIELPEKKMLLAFKPVDGDNA